jgi:N-methylhydantoinase B
MRQLVPPQSEVVGQSPGGGGWGDPFEREPERVHWDVLEGFVSRDSAKTDYGVCIRDNFSIDEVETVRLRASRGK